MTTRAREVLGDCEHALTDFAASANTEFQRTRWVAMTTLLRTVLDVLEKVDGPAGSREARRRIDAARKRLHSEEGKVKWRIYHEFVEDERNNVVHVYEVLARVNATIALPSLSWMPAVDDPRGGTVTTTYDFIMKDGPYQGRDPRELCREAINFWRCYLDDIDSGVMAPDQVP
jgi:hypothetical protein